MIISKLVLVKSSKYYYNLGYNIDDKYIKVDILHIPKGSHAIISAKCDYCNNEKEISYKDYNKNVSINGKFSCSIKCGCLKARETNLDKYGVDSTNKLNSVKEKVKEKMLSKYGVDHISKVREISESKSKKMKAQSSITSKSIKKYRESLAKEEKEIINKKRDETNLKKYGFKNVSQVDSIKEKIKDTNLNRYGGYTYQSEVLMDKVISTNLKRYGVTYSLSSNFIRDKIKITNLERYGFDYASKSKIVKCKSAKTNLERYGVENIMFLPSVVKNLNDRFYEKYNTNSYFKTDEFKNSIKYNPISNEIFRNKLIIGSHKNYIGYIGDNISKFNCDCGESHSFSISSIDFHNRNNSNISLCTICHPIGYKKSIKESELLSFIESIYDDEIIPGHRDGLEIDIYLPKLNIGFEFNGLYWHSDEYKNKSYHIDKTNIFKEKGIRIIHIWEDDWDNRREIIKSQIRNWIESSTNKIYARKCTIEEIKDSKLVREFLDKNHIQGYIRSTLKMGLYHNGELTSIMTFDNLEGRRKMEEGGWNLSRFCTKLNTNVIGGPSKLLKHFIKKYSPKRIISFADLDWSTGDLYYKLGFSISNISKPDYKYIVDRKRVNKQKFTKIKLHNMGYDISKTESQITKGLGLAKVYSCGQLKFELLSFNFI